jgi:hypothetical protein
MEDQPQRVSRAKGNDITLMECAALYLLSIDEYAQPLSCILDAKLAVRANYGGRVAGNAFVAAEVQMVVVLAGPIRADTEGRMVNRYGLAGAARVYDFQDGLADRLFYGRFWAAHGGQLFRASFKIARFGTLGANLHLLRRSRTSCGDVWELPRRALSLHSCSPARGTTLVEQIPSARRLRRILARWLVAAILVIIEARCDFPRVHKRGLHFVELWSTGPNNLEQAL